MVIVCVTGPDTELTIPKSSSFGANTTASGVVPEGLAGSVCVCVEAFVTVTVMLPGPLPLNSIAHWLPAGIVAPQLVAEVKPLAATCTPAASTEPRLRRVRFGKSSTERARDAVAAFALAGRA